MGNSPRHMGAVSQIKAVNQDNPFEQNNLRFQGQYYDQETELHYNRYRYYEPYSARYITKDPIDLYAGLNHHAYVLNPTLWVCTWSISDLWRTTHRFKSESCIQFRV